MHQSTFTPTLVYGNEILYFGKKLTEKRIMYNKSHYEWTDIFSKLFKAFCLKQELKWFAY